jgi:hypothetical protein
MTLDGCRRRRIEDRVGWYVGGLLAARHDSPGTLLVRLGGTDRERLLAAYPDTSACRRGWEAQLKVQADLGGDADAIREALVLARERRHATG